MKGRFPAGLSVLAAENPKSDTLYVSLSDVADAEVNEILIQTLRSRNYTGTIQMTSISGYLTGNFVRQHKEYF